jgi:membrane fusion protein (multidrug efflux system)
LRNGAARSGSDAATAESPDDATESATNVRVLVVEPTSLDEFLVVSGTLHPIRAAVLSTEEPGVVARIHRDKGTRVRASSPILELDRRILEAQKESTESARRLRQFNEEKTRQLFDQNSVSGQEMLLAHTQLEQAEAEAKIARLRYERALIRAPFDGFITDRYVELGELVAPGTRIARIVDPFTLKLAGALS